MKRRNEAGQTLVLVALGIVLFAGALGLALDIGYLRYLRRQEQSAADSAAIAGAAELDYTSTTPTAAAQADAARSGFTDGTNGATVTVNNPPASGPYASDLNYVEVIVQQQAPTFFIRAVPGGPTTTTTSARAVAHLGNGRGCAYGLATTHDAITVDSGTSVTATGCSVVANHNLTLDGGGGMTAYSIGYANRCHNCGSASPAPVKIVPAADPLAYLSPPSPSGCLQTGLTINGEGSPGSPVILFAGTYCNGLTIERGSTVSLSSSGNSVFVINGGTLTISGSTVTGTGVLIYVTGGAQVAIDAASVINLSAPTTEPYLGILFYQDPADNTVASLGGFNETFTGALYFPSATLDMNGTSSSASYTIIDADAIVFQGSTVLKSPPITTASPIQDAVLAE